jgi:hypothetical protein
LIPELKIGSTILQSALSWYGLIPPRVFAIAAVTTKPSNTFSNAIGKFEYVHLPLPFYVLGLNQVLLRANQYIIMASPEKHCWT